MRLPTSYDHDMTTPSHIYLGYSPLGDYIGYIRDEDEEEEGEEDGD